MPINSQQIQNQIQQKTNYGKKAHTDTWIVNQLSNAFNDSKRIVEQRKVEQALPFILWQDVWNQYGTYGKRRDQYRNKFSGRKYSRGRKVFVDFGYNIGREASMKHPAFVVGNYKELVIVAPVTSDDGKPFSSDIENSIVRCPNDGNVFMKDSVIELHQIRCISKNRIIKDLGVSATNYVMPDSEIDAINALLPIPFISYKENLETVIQAKLTYHYAPGIFLNLATQQAAIEKLKEENEELKEQLESLRGPVLAVAPSKQ